MNRLKHYYNLFIGKDDELIDNFPDVIIAGFGLGSPFFIFTICLDAIRALKEGKKVARQGWNGKGMYLWLLQASEVKKEWVKDCRLTLSISMTLSTLRL